MASMQLQLAPTCAWLRVSAAGSTGWGNWPSATDESKNCIAHTKTMWGVSQPRECDDMQRVDWSVCTCLRHENKFRLRVCFQVCSAQLRETPGCSSERRWRLWPTPGSHTRSSPCPSSAPGVQRWSSSSLHQWWWWLSSTDLTGLLSLRPTGVTA